MMKLQNILVFVLLGLLCASLAFAQRGGMGGMMGGRGGPRGRRPGGMTGFGNGGGPFGRRPGGDRPSGGTNGNRGPSEEPEDDARCVMDHEMYRECDECSRDMPVNEL